jgi:hypothetical protein
MKGRHELQIQQTEKSLRNLEEHLDGAVSRREYDSRMVATEAKLAEISVRLREIDLTLARRK